MEFREPNRNYGEFFGVGVLYGTIDPSSGDGLRALPGMIYCRNNNDQGELWLKTSVEDTGWSQVTVRGGPNA